MRITEPESNRYRNISDTSHILSHTLIFRASILQTTHSGCQTLRGRSETSRRIEKHDSVSRICDLSIPTMKPLPLQCSSLTQMKTHPVTFLGVKNVTSSTEFYLGRGASPSHNNSIWLKESTLECFSLNRSLHT